MKKLSILATMLFLLLFSTQNLNATSFFDGVTTTVVVCGNDPDGIFRCVTTDYPDGSYCYIFYCDGCAVGTIYSGCNQQ
jgi:hypothetical protein